MLNSSDAKQRGTLLDLAWLLLTILFLWWVTGFRPFGGRDPAAKWKVPMHEEKIEPWHDKAAAEEGVLPGPKFGEDFR